jgi:nucleoid-associated protein YgaU
VPIPHTGEPVVKDIQRQAPGSNDEPLDGSPKDKEPSFDIETPPTGAGGSSEAQASEKAGRAEGKLETILHRVEGRENFWDISRMYYNSGRYYKALWKANEDKVPQIDKLYRNTVLRIPPPEDLDPAYILPPGPHTKRPTALAAAPAAVAAADSVTTDEPRTTPRAADSLPIRRARRSDVELNLPVAESDAPEGGTRTRARSAVTRDFDLSAHRDSDDDSGASPIPPSGLHDRDPEVHTRAAVTRPIYKVRQYDTLRTIARDTLGDSRRASEILDLNREIVDDPSHLIVGQVLELPEDARPLRATNRR